MGKIFKTKRDMTIFAVLAAVFAVILTWTSMITGFEKDWYNLEYEDYQKHPEEYTVTEGTIKEFETDTHKTNPGITRIDLYFTAVVEVEYAGGQTELYKIPRKSGDKVGDRVKVAYDKRYDTEYDKMKKAEDLDDEDFIWSAPRLEKVENHWYSGVLMIVAGIYGVFLVLYVIWCSKKPD